LEQVPHDSPVFGEQSLETGKIGGFGGGITKGHLARGLQALFVTSIALAIRSGRLLIKAAGNVGRNTHSG
jgi:hypothetical protein